MQDWIDAGGNPKSLALYRSFATVETFAEGESRCLAAIHPALPTVGAIGDWRGGDAVRERAEAWLSAQGATIARGPMEVCSWFKYRVNLGPHEVRPFLMEPVERPERWIAAGYREAAHYTSSLVPHAPMIARGQRAADELRPLGWRVEALEADDGALLSPQRFREVLREFHRLSLEAFADAFAYAPIPEDALLALYEPLRPRLDPSLIFLAYAPDGHVAGFLFNLMDHGGPARMLIKSMAIDAEGRGKGLSWWLMGEAHQVALAHGLPDAVHCLRREDAVTTHLSKQREQIFRHYALLEKAF